MSDLTGEEAFDRLLTAVIDGASDLRKVQQERDFLKDEIRQAEIAAAKAQSAQQDSEAVRSNLQAEQARALPKLAELWQAANAVVRFTAPEGEERAVERLRIALKAAADHCDEIPF
jgi:hypothetical protein